MRCNKAVAVLSLLILVASPLSSALPSDAVGEQGSATPLAATKLVRTTEPWLDHYERGGTAPSKVNATYNVRVQSGSWYVMRYSTGWILTDPFTIHEGKRWDYAASHPMQGNPAQGTATLTALDPDGTPTAGYPGEVLAQTTALLTTTVSLDLRPVDQDAHVRLQLHILLNNTMGFVNLGITEWRLGEADLDCWRDPFYDIGRDYSRGDLSLGGGKVYPVTQWVAGGLKGSYYDNRDFTAWRYDQIDPVVDFDWGNNGPSNLGSNTFSIRWTGKINIVRSERYTFFLRIDDGGRLWIDDVQLIDQWRDQAATEYWAQVSLAPGLHDVRIEYYENQGGATCEFRWASPSISKQIVPQSALWGKDAVNTLLSERIQCPLGSTWELLLVDETWAQREVRVDVLDESTGQPIPGMSNLLADAIDLTSFPASLYPSIQLRARWVDVELQEPPTLVHWAVKWRPDRTWRTEFLSDIGIRGRVGLAIWSGALWSYGPESYGQFAFAESTNGVSKTISSGTWDMGGEVDTIVTTNASDVAMVDLNGDGTLDVLYTFSTPGADAVAYAGSTAGLMDIPMYTFSHGPPSGSGAVWTSILPVDVDANGRTDLLLAERTASGRGRLLVYTWNGTGMPSDPVSTLLDLDGTIQDLATGNFDGDAYGDIALALSNGTDRGALVLWGSSGGYSTSVSKRLLSRDCTALAVGEFVDQQWGWDDLVVGCDQVGSPNATDYVNQSNIIFSGDDDRPRILPWLGLGGEPATSLAVASLLADRRDVIAAAQSGEVYTYAISGEDIDRRYLYGPGATDIAGLDNDITGYGGFVISVSEDPGNASMSNYSLVESVVAYSDEDGDFPIIWKVPTDGAVAVASGHMLGNGLGSIRTDRINLGDPKYSGNWDRLVYRTGADTINQYQQVELRVLDGETEKLLWNATSSSAGGSFEMSDKIRAKEHPTIILEALLHNLNDNATQYLVLDDISINWTLRKPSPPAVLTLTADDPVVYRTNATRLRLTAEDEYDMPDDLAPLVQMRSPGALGWVPLGFGTAVWDGTSFVIDFKTTRDYATGNYSFRARVTDSDSMDSAWFQVDALVRVLNNPPGTPTITLTPDPPGTASDIRAVVVEQAFDRDTSYLSYLFEWSRDGTPVPEVTTDKVPAALTTRGETWSVVVRAFDGEDTGPPVAASVTVVNTAPALVRALAPVLIDEDHAPISVQLRTHFSDADGDPITFTLTGLDRVLWSIDPATDILTLTFPSDWWGAEEAALTASDGELSTSTTLEVDVRGIPDQPVIATIGGIAPVNGTFHIATSQDKPVAFLVTVEDPDSVRFTFRTDTEQDWLTVAAGNGTIGVSPGNGVVGVWRFNLSVQDDSGQSVVVPVELTVENVNDPPGVVYILQPKNGKVFQANDSILLQGYCADPDEPYGDVLTFTWYTNASTVPIGTGTAFTIPRLEPGDYNITLEVSDGQYIKRTWVRIRVLSPSKPPPDDDDGDGDGDGTGPRTMDSAGPIILALVLVLLVIVGATAFVTKQRAARGQARPPSPPVTAAAAKEKEGESYGAPLTGERTGITIEKPHDMRSIMTEPSVPRTRGEGAQPPTGWELKRGPPPPPAEKASFDGWEEMD